LGIGGEALASIPPLGLPPAGATAEQAARYPAVELLVSRGRAASADFCLDEHTVGAVVEIVRRLDGLPLAIELAAARLRVLPVAEIAARLVDRFRLLAGGMRTAVARHRTLRAVVEWSWELLTDDERLLVERLAVFAAGATAEAAAEVCADDQLSAAEIPDLLIALVDKSLLDVVPQPSVRYRMLETIREYGVERLDERSELEAARSKHAEYYSKVTRRLAPQLRTADQLLALAELAAERDNILAALRFLGDSGDGAGTLRLVLDLGWYWNITGSHTEMFTWTEFALAVSEGIDSPDRTKMEAGQVLAALAGPMEEIGWEDMVGRMGAAAERLAEIDDLTDPITWVVRLIAAFFRAQSHEVDELIEAGRAAPDPWVRAVTASTHVMLLENLGDLDGMRTEIQDAYDGFSAIGDRWGLSNILTARAAVRSVDGDVDGALADYRLALDYLAQLGATEDDLQIQLRMGSLALRRKDFATAREHIQQARRGYGDRPASRERTMMADIALLTVAMVEGTVDQAVELAIDIRRRMVGIPGNNMMFAHMASLAGAACAVSAIFTGDLALARQDLAGAYPAGIASSDLPVLAVVGVAVATYADAVGRHADAAEILGAAATLRGHDDLSDPLIGRVRDDAVTAIGTAAFDSAYATGQALPKDAAPKRLDPVLLEEEPVGVSGRSKDAAREVIPDGI
jgi:predicted ATPase